MEASEQDIFSKQSMGMFCKVKKAFVRAKWLREASSRADLQSEEKDAIHPQKIRKRDRNEAKTRGRG